MEEPYIQAILFCDKLVTASDGSLTLSGVDSKVKAQRTSDGKFLVKKVLFMEVVVGMSRPGQHILVRARRPSGQLAFEDQRTPIEFGSEFAVFQANIQIEFFVRESGAYHFDVYLNDSPEPLGRAVLNVKM